MQSTKDYLNQEVKPFLQPLIQATLIENPSDPVKYLISNF